RGPIRPGSPHGAGSNGDALSPVAPATKKHPNYTAVMVGELVQLAADDTRIVAITAGMPTGTGLSKFQAAYPERFLDVGIAEQHAVTLAAGLAVGGMRPAVAPYSPFLPRAFDPPVTHAPHNHPPLPLPLPPPRPPAP